MFCLVLKFALQRGEGRTEREHKFQKKAHRTFDQKKYLYIFTQAVCLSANGLRADSLSSNPLPSGQVFRYKVKTFPLLTTHNVHPIQVYTDWQENPVLTSIKTTSKPIGEIDFPAITICGQGTIDQVRFPGK